MVLRKSWGSGEENNGNNNRFVIAVNNNTLSTKFSLKHPGAVYGVAWSPFNKNLLATCCQDGAVRIWDHTTQTVVNHLTGHTAKAFNVAWNPLIPNVLASGSDDNTIRVWDIKQVMGNLKNSYSSQFCRKHLQFYQDIKIT